MSENSDLEVQEEYISQILEDAGIYDEGFLTSLITSMQDMSFTDIVFDHKKYDDIFTFTPLETKPEDVSLVLDTTITTSSLEKLLNKYNISKAGIKSLHPIIYKEMYKILSDSLVIKSQNTKKILYEDDIIKAISFNKKHTIINL